MEPRNRLLDDFVLSLTRRKRPRVCFVATASGDSKSYVARFYRAFSAPRAVPSHLPLFARDADFRTVRRRLLDQDVIYVGGGNTANLLAVWGLHGIDRVISEAWRRGVVLAGISAGMLCWFESGLTDSLGPLAPLHDGLGLLRGSACPHYDGEPKRRPTYRRFVAKRRLPAGYAAEDGAALHFVGTRLTECVSSRPRARVFRVEREAGRVRETPLPVRYLRDSR